MPRAPFLILLLTLPRLLEIFSVVQLGSLNHLPYLVLSEFGPCVSTLFRSLIWVLFCLVVLPAPQIPPPHYLTCSLPTGDSRVSQILTLSPMLLIHLPTASLVFHGIPAFHAISGIVCSPWHQFTSTLSSSISHLKLQCVRHFLFQQSVTFLKQCQAVNI